MFSRTRSVVAQLTSITVASRRARQMDIHTLQLRHTAFLKKEAVWWPLLLLAFGLILITFHQSDYFRAVPGDMGDARFNNVVLEHLFRWVCGKDPSLWSPGFFYPYPGTLSFSDNHFGTGAVYVMMRLCGLDPETAFIGWYSLAVPLNYFGCYYTLRNMGLSVKGSACGAFVFTFAFNVSAQYGHAQLGYRFAVPLAMLAWHRLVAEQHIKSLAWLAFWVTLQFYCSIYLGYFLLLLLIATSIAQQLTSHVLPASQRPLQALLSCAKSAAVEHSAGSILAIALCSVALAALLFPYLYYSRLYGLHRDYGEIWSMLPRPSSYLLADASGLWGKFDSLITDIPVRWEHQMFFGGSACLLAALGVIRRFNQITLTALLALLILVALTLNVDGHSFYALVRRLPLANAIRAVTRISLIMAFPLAVLAGSGFDWLTTPSDTPRAPKLAMATIALAFMLVEYTAYSTGWVSMKELRDRYAAIAVTLSSPLAENAILYVPPRPNEPYYFTELDGMRLSQAFNGTTINGYSGNAPDGFYDAAPSPCARVSNRLAGYAAFARLGAADYESLLHRVVVAGRSTPCEAGSIQRAHSSPETAHGKSALGRLKS